MEHDAETYWTLARSVMAAVETADALARGIEERGDAGINGGEVERAVDEGSARARMALIEFAVDANQAYEFLIDRHEQLLQYSAEYWSWRHQHDEWSAHQSVLVTAGGGGPGPEPQPPTPPFPGARP